MFRVLDDYVNAQLDKIAPAIVEPDIGDRHIIAGDNAGDVAQDADLIADRYANPRLGGHFVGLPPFEIEPMLLVRIPRGETIAIYRMHHDDAVVLAHADNALAGHRRAAPPHDNAGARRGAGHRPSRRERRGRAGAHFTRAFERRARIDRLDEILHRQLAAPHPHKDVVDAFFAKTAQRGADRLGRKFELHVGEDVVRHLPAHFHMFGALHPFNSPADGRARPPRYGDRLPVRRRRRVLRAQDQHHVAVFQGRAQGLGDAVDLHADAGVANISMHRIGEVEPGRAFRHGDDAPFWRKAENLVLEKLKLCVFERLVRVIPLLEHLHKSPRRLVRVVLPRRDDLDAGAAAFLFILVPPMGGDSALGRLMHFAGADLNLDALASAVVARGADHGGVDGTVIVRLRRGDVIVEFGRDHAPVGVDGAERAIAVVNAVDDDPESVDISDLVERDVLRRHFSPDRKGALFATVHLGVYTRFFQPRAQGLRQLDDAGDDGSLQALQPLTDQFVRLRIKLAKRDLFEFFAKPLHADAPGQRRVYLHCLKGDAPAFFRIVEEMQRAHVMQPVGELDEKDAHVLGHGHDELAEILRLVRSIGLQLDQRELGHAVHKARNFRPEQPFNVRNGRVSILDHVMEERRRHRGGIGFQFGKNARNGEWMRKIGIARLARLAAMGAHRIDIGAVEQVLVDVRIICPHTVDELNLTDEPHRLRARRRGPAPSRLRRSRLERRRLGRRAL